MKKSENKYTYGAENMYFCLTKYCSYMIISIPIKPYLKDFLINMYGQEPIPASKKNFIGIILEPMLNKPPADYVPVSYHPDPNRILVKLIRNNKEKEMRKNPLYYFYISTDDEINFQHYVVKFFNQTFICYSDAAVDISIEHDIKKHDLKDIFDNFCQKYSISSDNATYEMLKKKYYRYKCSIKHVNNRLLINC